ncbi:Uncharacterised protein [Mycobacteroides abscessus]|nr:Uncharacterised protein [Mycobacteroides abscessus]
MAAAGRQAVVGCLRPLLRPGAAGMGRHRTGDTAATPASAARALRPHSGEAACLAGPLSQHRLAWQSGNHGHHGGRTAACDGGLAATGLPERHRRRHAQTVPVVLPAAGILWPDPVSERIPAGGGCTHQRMGGHHQRPRGTARALDGGPPARVPRARRPARHHRGVRRRRHPAAELANPRRSVGILRWRHRDSLGGGAGG